MAKVKHAAKLVIQILLLSALIFGAMLFEVWQCNERFPNAVLACVLSGK